ncbi:DUF805 domain-containing protein [Brevibacterium epidermidis]|uniref:Uncharacterized membrane protein YhaH (DUF805 family) n=1 Tax=Brevibacterium epidermidis TaxID=1698 RepID=A0ABV4ENT9_BREEP|nr:DUF805 domain-containing protein [Brevibacterium epidermidis]
MSYDANAAYNSGAPGQGVPGAGQGYGGQGFGGAPRGAASPDDLSLPLYGASFGQAVKRFFKNYVNFKGRASRSEYWFAALFVALLMIIPVILYSIGLVGMLTSLATADPYGMSASAGPSGGSIAMAAIGGILLGIIGLAVLLPQLAIAWRRLHDANFSGLLYLISLTGIGGIVVFVLMMMPSKPEGQRFDA